MKKNEKSLLTRRKFISGTLLSSVGFLVLPSAASLFSGPLNDAKNGKKKLGVALVGLGSYATGQLGPALQQTTDCYLAGIVTGTPSKIKTWQSKYGIKDANVYNYENYDELVNNKDIDIVYVVLPNSMHAEYTIRALNAGKHVICEKPMAVSSEECEAMIKAAEKAGKFLSIGYRLHFDPFHREMINLVKNQTYGKVKRIDAAYSFVAQKGIWRLNKAMSGGGPLMDVGIYCLQAVLYLTGDLPVAITAKAHPVSDPSKFIGVEETLDFTMEMPNGVIANCRTSYAENDNHLKVETEQGWFELKPAFNYGGIRFGASDGRKLDIRPINQQAVQMDKTTQSYESGQNSIIPGTMGLRDLKIVEAIYEAMNTGKRVVL